MSLIDGLEELGMKLPSLPFVIFRRWMEVFALRATVW